MYVRLLQAMVVSTVSTFAALSAAGDALAQEAPTPPAPPPVLTPPAQQGAPAPPPALAPPAEQAAPAPTPPPALAPPAEQAAPAPPDERASGQDVVYLADGRILRGTLIEVIPDVGVRIRLATGDVATVARPDILHFEHTATPPGEEPPLPLRAPLPPVGWVHIEGSEVATLQHEGQGHGWISVCSSPCDRAVPTAGAYRIVGPDLKPSLPFALSARDGEYETLRVHAATHSATTTGILVLALGVPISLTVALGEMLANHGSGKPLSPTQRTIEQGSVLAGGVCVLLGVGLLITNLSTVASQFVLRPSGSDAPPSGTPYGGATQDAPRDAVVSGAGPATGRLPAAIGAPLLTARF
jgi:hypothetical protein